MAEEELGPFDSLPVVEDEGVSELEDDELHELGSLSFVQAFQGHFDGQPVPQVPYSVASFVSRQQGNGFVIASINRPFLGQACHSPRAVSTFLLRLSSDSSESAKL